VIDAMSSVLITGSNDGLGRDAARRLVDDGHRVVGHARSTEKADALRRELPGLAEVLVADLLPWQAHMCTPAHLMIRSGCAAPFRALPREQAARRR
jgi:NAD(P)-dependent dehydrogenase (short-subunit alcohol dehydrogenase family)